MFMLTMQNDTQRAATGCGIKTRETMITATPAIATELRVPGRTASYCSAN